MSNKSFESCKAKPVNFRSSFHKDYIPRDERIGGKVYRLCNTNLPTGYDLLESQLGEGTYFFIPSYHGASFGWLVVRNLNGNYCKIQNSGFYAGLHEGTFKLRSPRDRKDESFIRTLIWA